MVVGPGPLPTSNILRETYAIDNQIMVSLSHAYMSLATCQAQRKKRVVTPYIQVTIFTTLVIISHYNIATVVSAHTALLKICSKRMIQTESRKPRGEVHVQPPVTWGAPVCRMRQDCRDSFVNYCLLSPWYRALAGCAGF